jgi:hypothetical protein
MRCCTRPVGVVRTEVGLAAVGEVVIAVAEAGLAGGAAIAARAGGSRVRGDRAGVVARAAVVDVGRPVDLAAVVEDEVAVEVRSVARIHALRLGAGGARVRGEGAVRSAASAVLRVVGRIDANLVAGGRGRRARRRVGAWVGGSIGRGVGAAIRRRNGYGVGTAGSGGERTHRETPREGPEGPPPIGFRCHDDPTRDLTTFQDY